MKYLYTPDRDSQAEHAAKQILLNRYLYEGCTLDNLHLIACADYDGDMYTMFLSEHDCIVLVENYTLQVFTQAGFAEHVENVMVSNYRYYDDLKNFLSQWSAYALARVKQVKGGNNWYRVNQNNSGGYYIGAEIVFIQANSAHEANDRVSVLLNQSFCECCGPRWPVVYSGNAISYNEVLTLCDIYDSTKQFSL